MSDWRLNGQEEYLSNKTLYKITFPAFWETAFKDKNAFFQKIEQYAKKHVEATNRGHEFLEGEKVPFRNGRNGTQAVPYGLYHKNASFATLAGGCPHPPAGGRLPPLHPIGKQQRKILISVWCESIINLTNWNLEMSSW